MGGAILDREITQRNLSVISFCLFSAWELSFLFEGHVLYSIMGNTQIEGSVITELIVFTAFIGLFSGGLLIRSQAAAKRMMIISIIVCISGSLIFYLPFSMLWYIAIVSAAYFSSLFLASWGFYFKMYFSSEERFKAVAEVLIYSNILMVIINGLTANTSASIGLAATILALACTLPFLFRLESHSNIPGLPQKISLTSKPFILLCIFILIITINSGLMYQVVNPAFAHYGLLTTYYWAIPYILALLILRNLPSRINKTYVLYVAIAMSGLSYILFMWLDRSVASYLTINTLMLGAFGVCDLFWWSILGSYLDYNDNAAKVLGVGLSMNVLGVFIGGVIGREIASLESSHFVTSIIAVTIIFAVLIIFPVLNSQLTKHLKSHEFLVKFADMAKRKKDINISVLKNDKRLTEKESEVINLMLRGYTYKGIAEYLSLSENTIKYHIKNIYQKFNVSSKMELMKVLTDNEEMQQ